MQRFWRSLDSAIGNELVLEHFIVDFSAGKMGEEGSGLATPYGRPQMLDHILALGIAVRILVEIELALLLEPRKAAAPYIHCKLVQADQTAQQQPKITAVRFLTEDEWLARRDAQQDNSRLITNDVSDAVIDEPEEH